MSPKEMVGLQNNAKMYVISAGIEIIDDFLDKISSGRFKNQPSKIFPRFKMPKINFELCTNCLLPTK